MIIFTSGYKIDVFSSLFFQLEEAAIIAAWDLEMYEEAMQWNWPDFEDLLTLREFAKIVEIGTAVLDDDDLNRVRYCFSQDRYWFVS